jgi:hypothetical protein
VTPETSAHEKTKENRAGKKRSILKFGSLQERKDVFGVTQATLLLHQPKRASNQLRSGMMKFEGKPALGNRIRKANAHAG